MNRGRIFIAQGLLRQDEFSDTGPHVEIHNEIQHLANGANPDNTFGQSLNDGFVRAAALLRAPNAPHEGSLI
jgi:hypothetical protein